MMDDDWLWLHPIRTHTERQIQSNTHTATHTIFPEAAGEIFIAALTKGKLICLKTFTPHFANLV